MQILQLINLRNKKKQVILKGDTYNMLKRKWGNNEAEK